MLQSKRSVSLEMDVILVFQNAICLLVCSKRYKAGSYSTVCSGGSAFAIGSGGRKAGSVCSLSLPHKHLNLISIEGSVMLQLSYDI